MSTGISWTDETWTVVTGCSKVSAGCQHCYAERLAPRLAAMGKAGYTDKPWTAKNASENVTLHPERLEQPLRWKKPRRIFVTSMGDLFHEQVPDEFIDRVFAVMALATRHTFQVLTKRPQRMAEYLNARDWQLRVDQQIVIRFLKHSPRERDSKFVWRGPVLPNVWLGTSVEDQRAADERIPHLLRTPAAVRFLSCEPLLGRVELPCLNGWDTAHAVKWLGWPILGTDGIGWVIAGGESGPNYRPLDLDWVRSLRDQCLAAGVPFFYKQASGPRNEMDPYLDGEMWRQMPQQTPQIGEVR